MWGPPQKLSVSAERHLTVRARAERGGDAPTGSDDTPPVGRWPAGGPVGRLRAEAGGDTGGNETPDRCPSTGSVGGIRGRKATRVLPTEGPARGPEGLPS